MYPATKENQVSFHLLHKKDCGRIKNQRVCSECGEVLDYDDLIKGYEYEKGEYIAITPEELKDAQSETSDAIAIQGFVDLEEIDPIYFDSPYYLVPGKHGEKAYALLRHTLEKSGKAGIATFVLRTKEYLAVVRVKDNALLLNTMHFADEVRDAEGIPSAEADVNEGEAKMALQLVDAMSDEFDAGKYKDQYNDALLQIIEKKLKGKPIRAKKEAQAPTNVLDLMSRLKESIDQSSGAQKTATKSGASAKSRAAATKTKKAPAKKSAGQAPMKTRTKAPSKGKAPASGEKPRLRLVA